MSASAGPAIASLTGDYFPAGERGRGDGFGEVLAGLIGARRRSVLTLDAAHQPRRADWWWQAAAKTAIVESAKVIGLALLPPKKFHPFQLDTWGLGKILKAASRAAPRQCVVGIGGSATNDGGFGLARALGWQFLDRAGNELDQWPRLRELAGIRPPLASLKLRVIVAVDVRNLLLGTQGCSRVYGPQKGLYEFDLAEKCRGRMASLLKQQHGVDCANVPGAGAAGGLGFGLMAFAGAKLESGFDLFARYAQLEKRIRAADVTARPARLASIAVSPSATRSRCRTRSSPVICFRSAYFRSAFFLLAHGGRNGYRSER